MLQFVRCRYRSYSSLILHKAGPLSGAVRRCYYYTNDLAQDSDIAVQEVCGMRWKIEQFHRELKQTTGIEKNQCRKARIQRNHIARAMLVWLRLTDLARQTQQTVYRIKHGLLDNYLCQQLKNPSVKMRFA